MEVMVEGHGIAVAFGDLGQRQTDTVKLFTSNVFYPYTSSKNGKAGLTGLSTLQWCSGRLFPCALAVPPVGRFWTAILTFLED